jgi:hypothetical protein
VLNNWVTGFRLVNTRRQTEKELGGSQDQLLRAANEAKRVHHDAKREFDSLQGLKMVSKAKSICGDD